MKLISFIFVGLVTFVYGEASALDISGYKDEWGISNVSELKCQGSNFTDSHGCKAGCNLTTHKVAGWFATDVREGGVRVCPITVDSYRTNTWNWNSDDAKQPHTTYYKLDGAPCVWLCKNGWSGDTCQHQFDSPLETNVCVTSNVLKDTNITTLNKGDPGVSKADSIVAIFDTGRFVCTDSPNGQKSTDNKMEHDIVLGIVGDLQTAHGAYVQPLVVRAFCGDGKTREDCRTLIKTAGTKQLLCSPGYRPNAIQDDCEPIRESVCNGITQCDGWSDKRYFTDEYREHQEGDCIEYRCAAAGYGFKQGTKECIECANTDTQTATLIDATGECIFTDISKKVTVDEDGTINETERIQTTRNKLSSATDTDGQLCWMKYDNPEDYKSCVLGGQSETKDTRNVHGKHPTTVTFFPTQTTNNLQPSGNLSDLSTLGNETTSQTSGTTIPGPNINPTTLGGGTTATQTVGNSHLNLDKINTDTVSPQLDTKYNKTNRIQAPYP